MPSSCPTAPERTKRMGQCRQCPLSGVAGPALNYLLSSCSSATNSCDENCWRSNSSGGNCSRVRVPTGPTTVKPRYKRRSVCRMPRRSSPLEANRVRGSSPGRASSRLTVGLRRGCGRLGIGRRVEAVTAVPADARSGENRLRAVGTGLPLRFTRSGVLRRRKREWAML